MYLLDDGGPVLGLKPMNCPVTSWSPASCSAVPRPAAAAGRDRRRPSQRVERDRNGLLRACALSIDDVHIFCAPASWRPRSTAAWSGRWGLSGCPGSTRAWSSRRARRSGSAMISGGRRRGGARACPSTGTAFPDEVRLREARFDGPKIDLAPGATAGPVVAAGTMQLEFHAGIAIRPRRCRPGRRQAPAGDRPTGAMLGSLEWFIAILLEHTDGAYRHGGPCRPLCCRFPSPPRLCGRCRRGLRSAGARAEPGGSVRRSAPASAMPRAGACPRAGRRRPRTGAGTARLREAGGAQRTTRSPTPPTRSRPPSGRRR